MAIKIVSTEPIDMLDDLSAEKLTALIKAAEEKRDAKLAEAKRSLLEEMRGRAEQLGLSLDDLLPQPSTTRAAPVKAAAKPSDITHRLPSGATRKARGKLSKAYKEELEALKRDDHLEEEFRVS